MKNRPKVMKEIPTILIINYIPYASFNCAYRTPRLQVTQEALVECGLETTDDSFSLPGPILIMVLCKGQIATPPL